MKIYCQHCNRAVTAGAENCPHCEKPPVEKNDMPEDGRLNTGRSFRLWFTNIFWYHFKWHTVIGIFFVVIVVMSVHSVVTREEQDFQFVVASEYPVFFDQGAALTEFWKETVPGLNNVSYNVLFMGEQSEMAMANMQLMLLTLIDETNSLFIIGESMIGWYSESMEIFITAGEMGVEGNGPKPQLVPLEGSSLMEGLGFIFEPMFALIRRPPEGGCGRFELSAACLEALLSGE
jgi:hypothetical protein